MDFGTRLDLAPYMSDRRGDAQPYELFGVLVHAGHTVHSGHYYCFVRAANGLWHQCDDHQVKQARGRPAAARPAARLAAPCCPLSALGCGRALRHEAC